MPRKLSLMARGKHLSAQADGATCLVRVLHKTTPDGTLMYVELDEPLADALKNDELPVADKTDLRDTICEAIRRAFNDAMGLQ